MTKRTVTTVLLATAAAAVVAFAPGAASAAGGAAKPTVVPIVMHDPGCHWFQTAGKLKDRLVVPGATTFRNIDEAALIFKGKGFTRHLAVGKSLRIAKPGFYTITMVGQKPDDNTLRLFVK